MTTKEAADKVLVEMVRQSPGCAFDPNTILIIIEALKILLPLLLELCRKEPGEVSAVCREAQYGGIPYRVARRQLRRELSWKDYYAAGGDKLLDGLLAVGATATEEDVQSIYLELSK